MNHSPEAVGYLNEYQGLEESRGRTSIAKRAEHEKGCFFDEQVTRLYITAHKKTKS